MTQLIYGGYAHAVNSVYLTAWSRQTVLGQTGWPEVLRVNCSFRAKLIDTNMTSLMSQAANMQLAYSIGGQTLVFLDNNGLPTTWFLNSATAIGGVMVTNPVSYGEVKGAEGTLYMYCTFGLTADYLVNNGNNYVVFHETVSFSDNNGNPLTVERVPVYGPPVIQQVTQSSFYYATQQGELWQSQPGPQPMSPIWPSNLRGTPNSRRSALLPPKAIRGNAYRYGVNWCYEFVSQYPLVGYPNVY
jgi:hypothetical protein